MPRAIPPGGTRGSLYGAIAMARLGDASCLLRAKRVDGAIYLAGYAIECCLKEAVCIRTGQNHLPAAEEVHSWDRLVDSANLWSAILAQPEVFSLYSSLSEKWKSCQWGSALRYRVGLFQIREAQRLYSEIEALYDALVEMM